MNDIPHVIPQLLKHDFIAWFLLIAGIFVLLFLNRGKIYSHWLELKTRRCLSSLGIDQITNVKCPDGLGHVFTIDRLILRNNGISLLVYKKYPGKIFCADHIDDWTQMLGQKSYKFKNPLFELDIQVKAVAACFPQIDVDGYLFFDHNAEFPKGHPHRVIHPAHIPVALQRHPQQSVDQQVLNAWQQFGTTAENP
jgi:hypothetical protein